MELIWLSLALGIQLTISLKRYKEFRYLCLHCISRYIADGILILIDQDRPISWSI